MKQFLISSLILIIFAEMSCAAGVHEVKTHDEKGFIKRTEAPHNFDDKPLKRILAANFHGDEIAASNAFDSLMKILQEESKVIEFAAALEDSTRITRDRPEMKEIGALQKQVKFMLLAIDRLALPSATLKDVIAPLLGASRLALTGMDSDSSPILTRQLYGMNLVLVRKANGHSIDIKKASLLIFANTVGKAATGYVGKPLTAVDEVSIDIRDKYDLWKKYCR